MTKQSDSWDLCLYDRFSAERRQPFDDLVGLCRPITGRIVDLGCGSGQLTADLHRRLGAKKTIGIDSSASMLAEAPQNIAGLSFERGDIRTWDGPKSDLVFANASLQWVDDHFELLKHVVSNLCPNGQLAFQLPANFSHPSHTLAKQLAQKEPYASLLRDNQPIDRGSSVLLPQDYANIFYSLGAHEQSVSLRIYGHVLESSAEVLSWVEGTLLTPYRSRLSPEHYGSYLADFEEMLMGAIGNVHPYFYAFPRILAWAQF